MRETQQAVREMNQRNERDQHGSNVKRQKQTVCDAARDGIQNVDVLSFARHLNLAGSSGRFYLRNQKLGDQNRAGRGHHHSGQKMASFGAEKHVRAEN